MNEELAEVCDAIATKHIEDFILLRGEHGMMDLTDQEITDFCEHVRKCVESTDERGNQVQVAKEVRMFLESVQTSSSKLPN